MTSEHCGQYSTCRRLDIIGKLEPEWAPDKGCPCVAHHTVIARAKASRVLDEHPAADALRWAGFGPEDK